MTDRDNLKSQLTTLETQRATISAEVDAIYSKADHEAYMKKIDLSGIDKKIKRLTELVNAMK